MRRAEGAEGVIARRDGVTPVRNQTALVELTPRSRRRMSPTVRKDLRLSPNSSGALQAIRKSRASVDGCPGSRIVPEYRARSHAGTPQGADQRRFRTLTQNVAVDERRGGASRTTALATLSPSGFNARRHSGSTEHAHQTPPISYRPPRIMTLRLAAPPVPNTRRTGVLVGRPEQAAASARNRPI